MRKTSREEFLKYARHSEALLRLEVQVSEYARRNRHNKSFCANSAWYRFFKPRMCALVGWGASDRRLKSEAAYDAVYNYLYNLLPDCNHGSVCW
jgi:hypothetical protein